MKTIPDPGIQRLKDIFESRGFIVTDLINGFSFQLDCLGMPDAVIDFYVLKSKPGSFRARLKKNADSGDGAIDALWEISFQVPAELEFVRNHLEEELDGAARIQKFYYAGCRNHTVYYYAGVLIGEANSEMFLRKSCAERALVQLKGVDSKLFRQGLDSLGLSRSSIVRLGLTRIFRGSTDVSALLEAASAEAYRIIHAEEWKTVRELVKQSHVPFMKAVFSLLWEEICRAYMKLSWETLHK
jgi:hypothetical protein